jgi:hypothetical protein
MIGSRARRNLHRFRVGTTAGREIGDRAKIPARDYARGSPISQPSPTIRTINTNNSDCRRESTRRDGTDPRRRASRWCGSGSRARPSTFARRCRDHGGQGGQGQLTPCPRLCISHSAPQAAGGEAADDRRPRGGVSTRRPHSRTAPAPCRTKPAAGMSRVDPVACKQRINPPARGGRRETYAMVRL